jgi:hypothetical protein
MDDSAWEDRYDRLARQVSYWEVLRLDDRPDWEQEHDVESGWCRTCFRTVVHRKLDLDDYDQCARCRVAAGWCRWCFDERIAYRSRECCRTCYRWLIRNQDCYDDEELVDRLLSVVERRRARNRGR